MKTVIVSICLIALFAFSVIGVCTMFIGKDSSASEEEKTSDEEL